MPHIHGVAWISKSYLKSINLSDPISDGTPKQVTMLADLLISCRLPDGPDDKSKN